MSQESKEPTQFSDYPVNLFEEPRDHANQWDVSALWPDHKPEPCDEMPAQSNPTTVTRA